MRTIPTVSFRSPAAPLLLLLALSSSAGAQAPADRVKLDLSRAELAAIAQALMELPYKTAAPLLNELSRQVEAQAPKVPPAAPEAPPVTPAPPEVPK